MFRLASQTAAIVLLGVSLATAQPACLPKSVYKADAGRELPTLDFGLVNNEPTLCAFDREAPPGRIGCWGVNPANGALSASSARSLPGHSQKIAPDAKGCIQGFCVKPAASPPEPLLFAASTDNAHVVVLKDTMLHVFDATTKAQTGTIDILKTDAPDSTNVSNVPIQILYVNDTIYVVGSDAGPFMGVWGFKQNGARLGRINRTSSPNSEMVNVFNGAVGIVDATHIAVSDAGLQTLVLVSSASGQQQAIKRTVSRAPCTQQQMGSMAEGDLDLPAACRSTIRARYEPFFEIAPLRLASGDFIVPLRGPAQGHLAVLNGTDLVEKARYKLAQCR